MAPHLLILGGTAEASALARRVAELGLSAVFSYAGRVARPDAQPIPVRVGGFGGVAGLAGYIKAEGVTHLIDATHPFASGMSRNAVAAADATGVPLVALVRPAWMAGEGDCWHHADDINDALHHLDGAARRVFLAIGRTEVAGFAARPQHHYLLRFVDAPEGPPPLPRHEVLVARGPFDVETDRALLEAHRIELVVSKNSGGAGARAKLEAARQLGLPVLMIGRPAVPPRREVATVEDVIRWLSHPGTLRGV